MYLKTLQLRQFRNYQEQRVDFIAPKTILVGNNAQGKSNLLEAVELLATLRSHRMARDRDLVREGEAIGQITAILERQTGIVDLSLTLRRQGRRTVALNSEYLRRQLDFLGVPLLIAAVIAPLLFFGRSTGLSPTSTMMILPSTSLSIFS